MAKKARVVGQEAVAEELQRKRTGLVWACASNVIQGSHPSGPVANSIKIDKRGCCYVRCPACGDQHFFSREKWTVHHGLTPEQAMAMGLMILS